MKAVKRINYLFLRKQTYYFRFNFLSTKIHSDIRLSLKTKNLVYALQCLEKLSPFIRELKCLASREKCLNHSSLKVHLDRIREQMKRKLELADIDSLVARAEENTSNYFHMMDVLSDTSLKELPEDVLLQLSEVLLCNNPDVIRQKVLRYSQNSELFQKGLSLLVKSALVANSNSEFVLSEILIRSLTSKLDSFLKVLKK